MRNSCNKVFSNLLFKARSVSALGVGLVFSVVFSLASPAWAEPETITFLHTNDLYEITAKDGKGGMGRLADMLKEERSSASHSITTFGGDLLSPSVMSGLTNGAQMIELLNAIGMDVAVLGNHEYDFGPEILEKRISESKFPWLASNVFDTSGGQANGTSASLLVQAGSYKIGFFGVLTTETETMSSPGDGIIFKNVIETAKASVAALKEQGADVIVAMTHQDFSEDRELVQSVKGINLVLGGHDHDPITYFERGVMIFKAGHDAQYLGTVDMTVDYVEKRGKKKLVVDYGWRMLPVRSGPVDANVQALVDRHEAVLDEKLNIVIGSTSVELDSRRGSVRSMETNFGNLIAEAMMVSVGADVGMANGGGIRGNRTYEAGTKLTRRDILSELPFGNVTVKLEMSGALLLEALENGVSKVEDGAGRFPQISGMRFVYDPAKPAGFRVVTVTVGGKPLDVSATYTMATNDFSAGGGDGYKVLKEAKNLIDASAATYMATDVMNYIETKGTIAPTVDGRISTP